ncbi:MAG: M28 family peptidase [Thermoplasmata archaeon]
MNERRKIESELLARVSGDRAKAFVTELAGIRHRIPGSDEERVAAERIADEMRKLGLEVVIEEFDVVSWEHHPAKLTLSNGSTKSFDVEFMPYSPPVRPDGSKGRLAPLRFGFPAEYSVFGDEAIIPIVDFNYDAGAHLVELAAARSGKNIIALGIIAHIDRAFRIESTPMLAKPISFPVFSIRKEDGEEIRRLCAGGDIVAELEGESKIIPDAKSENVIGRMKGSSKGKHRIIVSAHHDGWFAGANDNLSSVASILEVARALSGAELRRAIDFISFGSEEGGTEGYQYYLWGSRQYVKKHSREMKDIACILNCELAGATNREALIIDCTPDMISFYEGLLDNCKNLLSENGWLPEFGIATPTASQADQMNFSLAGVPSTLFAWAWYDEYHTDIDKPEILKPKLLATFSKMVLLSAHEFATLEKLPLSLTRYARIIRMGHTGLTSHIMGDLCKESVPGLEHLKRVSSGLLDFNQAFVALDSLSVAAADLERRLSAADDDAVEDLNSKLLGACNVLNSALCRTGGLMGEDPMFPGYLEYIEELRKMSEAKDKIRGIAGSDIPTEILSEFVPIQTPEVSFREFEMHDEISALSRRLERARVMLQTELDRITQTINLAARHISG